MQGRSIEEIIRLANAGYFDNNHQTRMLSHRGQQIPIDLDLCDLIKKIWDLGIETKFSCQGDNEFDRSGYIAFDKEGIILFFFHFPHAINIVGIDVAAGNQIKYLNFQELMNFNQPGNMFSIRFRNDQIKDILN